MFIVTDTWLSSEKWDFCAAVHVALLCFSEFLRTDDAFVLRFLRARKFDTVESFKLLARYFEFRQNNPSLFKNFIASEAGIKAALYDGLPSVLPNCDQNGRKIIVLFAANWDNGRYQLPSVYRAILLTLEKLIDDEACQINGFVFILDWSQFTFNQSRSLNPKVLKQMVEGLQVSTATCLNAFIQAQ